VASKEIKVARVVSTKVVTKAARVVSRVVAVGVPNSKIRTQTVVEVFGTASKTILGAINDRLFEAAAIGRCGLTPGDPGDVEPQAPATVLKLGATTKPSTKPNLPPVSRGAINFRNMIRLFDDDAIDAHLRALSAHKTLQPTPPKRPSSKEGVLNVGVFSEIGYRESAADREEGIVRWFDQVREMGFVAPLGVDPADRANHLFLAGPALRRSGWVSVEKGDRITYRRQEARQPGKKAECQEIEIVERAAK
jgi:cold shock CspA family protein